jgi:hypothetical protein
MQPPFSPEATFAPTATFSRPADNTAYQAGDAIANSGTAASVVPMTFTLPQHHGRITGVRCVVTPASSNLVIAAFAFDLLLFRPAASIPFAAGSYAADNAALAISAAAYREIVGVWSFVATGWRSPAGSVSVAGVTGYQAASLPNRPFAPFNVGNLASRTLLGVVQAQGAWTPTGIVNRFDFTLDVDHG